MILHQMLNAWLYSFIEYQENPRSERVLLGVVLFAPSGDRPFLSRIVEHPPAKLGDEPRALMGIRAVVSRLKRSCPRTAGEIRAFVSREANEIRLGEPDQIFALESAEATVRKLFETHVARRTLTCPRRTPGPFAYQEGAKLVISRRESQSRELLEA